MKKRIFFGIVAIIAAFSIIGCKEEDPPPSEPFVLIVKGIPSEVTIFGAALLSQEGLQNETPTAVGMNSPNGTFKLYHKSTDSYMPDTTRPWNDSGDFYITLSTGTTVTSPQYFYTDGAELFSQENQQVPQFKIFKFDKATTEIEFEKFKLFTPQ